MNNSLPEKYLQTDRSWNQSIKADDSAFVEMTRETKTPAWQAQMVAQRDDGVVVASAMHASMRKHGLLVAPRDHSYRSSVQDCARDDNTKRGVATVSVNGFMSSGRQEGAVRHGAELHAAVTGPTRTSEFDGQCTETSDVGDMPLSWTRKSFPYTTVHRGQRAPPDVLFRVTRAAGDDTISNARLFVWKKNGAHWSPVRHVCCKCDAYGAVAMEITDGKWRGTAIKNSSPMDVRHGDTVAVVLNREDLAPLTSPADRHRIKINISSVRSGSWLESDEVTLTGPFDWSSVKLRLAVHPTDPLSLRVKAEGSVRDLQRTDTVTLRLRYRHPTNPEKHKILPFLVTEPVCAHATDPRMEQDIRVRDLLGGVTVQLKQKYYTKFRDRKVNIQAFGAAQKWACWNEARSKMEPKYFAVVPPCDSNWLVFDLHRCSDAPRCLPSSLAAGVAQSVSVSAGLSIASARAPINQPDSFDQLAAETSHADGMARLTQPECDALEEPCRLNEHALASNDENNGRVSIDQPTLLKVVKPEPECYTLNPPKANDTQDTSVKSTGRACDNKPIRRKKRAPIVPRPPRQLEPISTVVESKPRATALVAPCSVSAKQSTTVVESSASIDSTSAIATSETKPLPADSRQAKDQSRNKSKKKRKRRAPEENDGDRYNNLSKQRAKVKRDPVAELDRLQMNVLKDRCRKAKHLASYRYVLRSNKMDPEWNEEAQAAEVVKVYCSRGTLDIRFSDGTLELEVPADRVTACSRTDYKEHPADTERCNICFGTMSYPNDPLIQCEGPGCGAWVHALCYDVEREEWSSDEPWLCRCCKAHPKGIQRYAVTCQLCPDRKGAFSALAACRPVSKQHFAEGTEAADVYMSQTLAESERCGRRSHESSESKWIHQACALWVLRLDSRGLKNGTELNIFNEDKEVIGISHVAGDRWRLKCTVCGDVNGAPLQCSEGKCVESYHLFCARRSGYEIQMLDKNNKYRWLSFCEKHTRERRRLRDQPKVTTGDSKRVKASRSSSGKRSQQNLVKISRKSMKRHVKSIVKAIRLSQMNKGNKDTLSRIMQMEWTTNTH